MFDSEEQDRLNKRCAKKPKRGDYWHEMYLPICAIVEVVHDKVTYAHKVIKHEDGVHQTFDYEDLKTVTLKEFYEWLQYDSKGMKDKFWADVIRN